MQLPRHMRSGDLLSHVVPRSTARATVELSHVFGHHGDEVVLALPALHLHQTVAAGFDTHGMHGIDARVAQLYVVSNQSNA